MTNPDQLIDAPTAARAAALWWAAAIGAPSFRLVDSNSGPDDKRAAFFGEAMAGMLADRHPVTEEAGAKFADALERIVNERSHYYAGGLHTDYGPGAALAAAAAEAGVHYSRFPYKTNMWIKVDHVYVSAGYRAQLTLIWAAPDWQRPQCANQHWEWGGDPHDEICGLPRYHAEPCGDWRPDPKRCAQCGDTYSTHYTGDRKDHDHHWKELLDTRRGR